MAPAVLVWERHPRPARGHPRLAAIQHREGAEGEEEGEEEEGEEEEGEERGAAPASVPGRRRPRGHGGGVDRVLKGGDGAAGSVGARRRGEVSQRQEIAPTLERAAVADDALLQCWRGHRMVLCSFHRRRVPRGSGGARFSFAGRNRCGRNGYRTVM